MRLARPLRNSALALAATLALAAAGPVRAQSVASDEPIPVLSLDEVPDEIVGVAPEGEPGAAAEPGAEAASGGDDAGPGLAEATGDAVASVLDAARRDGAGWARRTHAWKDETRARARAAWQALLRDPRGTVDTWLAENDLPDTQALALPAAAAVMVLVLALSLLRAKGDLKVSIEYPAELRGTFSVRLSRRANAGRRGPRTASPASAQRAKRKASASSRTERHLVSRETDFPGVPTGRCFVTVDGFLQPLDDETVIGTHFDEQEIRVRRGHTVRLDFDFHPKQCPVDVKVLWDKKPVNEALVAWRGQPHSLRYARGGPVRLGIERGQHTLVVGSGDRVAELPVDVLAFQPVAVEIDLAQRDKLLFSGCPPAVEPYLHGDLPAAARALEREGQEQVSHLVLAQLHAEQGYEESAARHYADAGQLLDAAEIHRKLAQFDKSAQLYESAGELTRAAEMYRSAGDTVKAGEAYERAREFESAAECFEEVGNVSKWCEALEKDGKPFEAARVALEHGDQGRAIRSLQVLTPNDSDYVAAANLLVEVLQREGHLDMAVQKVEEVILTQGADEVPLETCDQLARLFDENEQCQRSLDVLEIIRRRDAAYPELAARMEELRKKLKQQAAGRDSTGFGGGFRYEILEEVGRGGMGIVFKARDRRLGRVVALKRLPDNLRNHPKAVELFLREARACAALNHPNIVTVHDAGQEGETFYITMELMEGLPLNTILKRNGSLGPRDVAKLGIQACNGLHYAHEQRIVHRDIKTGNFFFTKSKTLKIMDFGLAKMVEEVRRASTVIGGTPYYMAPEQSLGQSADHRADLYALGVTFFELLTGKVPFPDGDVAYHHRHTPAPDPRDRAAEIPHALAQLILNLMAKSPDERPQSASEVRDHLQTLLT
jgi:tRNA A-37 threonylcarbamoyl transferase component Bud32